MRGRKETQRRESSATAQEKPSRGPHDHHGKRDTQQLSKLHQQARPHKGKIRSPHKRQRGKIHCGNNEAARQKLNPHSAPTCWLRRHAPNGRGATSIVKRENGRKMSQHQGPPLTLPYNLQTLTTSAVPLDSSRLVAESAGGSRVRTGKKNATVFGHFIPLE